MKQWFYRFFIELTNHRLSSFLLRRFSQSKLSKRLIPAYLKVYNIQLADVKEDVEHFQSLHELFIRELKPEARAIDSKEKSIVSPVDAVIEEVGTILPSKEIVVKGKTYSIAEMLGSNELLEKYVHGTFMVMYLSPSHYHRIHSPITGTIRKQWTLGSKSYPVNQLGLKYGKDTLAKNYRKITEIESSGKHIAMVKVGAMFVNSIEITHKGDRVEKGKEIAYFTFGSTVILLFENETFEVNKEIQTPCDIQVGQAIGHFR
ncbi:phosphatidylserine decarboxylase [Bacillus sp. PS06]|uniref:phosphatidylserine decarboxylase n=1 Tax=Bacillus sp. PS06 TaxID=2764176 RepID=UPI001780F435|nr:phosphatidylserine decarboxylase [Bacillus sp. PS06]MBD8069230.1 phosphatidylserine decarboxylase [Bacillus sp. PS06]